MFSLVNLFFSFSVFKGVVMLTVMVCCFLVFGVQKGDENVLNSSRRGYVSRTFKHTFWYSRMLK